MTLADSNTLESEKKSTSGELACSLSLESYLQRIREVLPTVDRTLRDHGDKTIAQYLETQNVFSATSFQPRDDLAEVVYNYAKPLLGEEVAREAASELLANPVVLTANHHGVDYFAQSVQGTLIFSLRKINGKQAKTVPVFACGNVPLDNLTYPRGVLLYPPSISLNQKVPFKAPIYSNKYRRETVSAVRSISGDMLLQFTKRIGKESSISKPAEIADLVIDAYSVSTGSDSYSQQATQVNSVLWSKIIKRTREKTNLVYLELEKIASRLVCLDLENTESLLVRLLFSEPHRIALEHALDQEKSCWNIAELSKRLTMTSEGHFKQSGTFMFWGVDERKRRIPLLPVEEDGKCILSGRSDSGERWDIELTVSAIAEAIQNERLIPSVFTSFLVITLARGVTALGGYYQADYLPKMKRAVEVVFQNCNDSVAIPSKVDGYLSGMQPVLATNNFGLYPTGPVELINDGGIDTNWMNNVSIKDAHMGSLHETLEDVLPNSFLPQFRDDIAEQLFKNLRNDLVITGLYSSTERNC